MSRSGGATNERVSVLRAPGRGSVADTRADVRVASLFFPLPDHAEKRKKHLEWLAGKESGFWAKVGTLIATKQPRRYDEAVSLLQDLHDLADMQGKSPDFFLRMSALHNEHTKKATLVDRFRKAKLLE